MTSVEALRLLESLSPAFSTNDAAACLRIPPKQASVVLGRLAKAGQLDSLYRGRWAFRGRLHPFAVPEVLTRPTPSYVSLQSALHHHAMIERRFSFARARQMARRIKAPSRRVLVLEALAALKSRPRGP